MAPLLPHDLIDPIAEALSPVPWTGPKDYAPLAACSLVSRSFREPFQRQLFRSLTFTWKNSTLGVDSFLELTSSNARLATYIRALHLRGALFSWESERASLEKFFPLLEGLTHLGLSFGHVDLHWSKLPANFRAIVVDFLSVPTLRCLALYNCWGVPSSIVRHALLSYEEVSLMDVGIAVEEEEEVFPLQKRTTDSPLCRLSVRYTQMLDMSVPVHALIRTAAGGSQSASFSLRRFEMTAADPTMETFGDLEPLVTSLQHLMLHFEYTRAPKFFDKQLPLPATPNLHIRALTISSKNFISACVLRTLIRLPASLPNIEQINILLDWPRHDFLNASKQAQLLALYNEVDGVLANLAGFCELHICLSLEAQARSVLPQFETRTRGRLPLAHEAGKLRFSSRDVGRIMESPFFRPHLPRGVNM